MRRRKHCHLRPRRTDGSHSWVADMNKHQTALAKRVPELNAAHMETLAVSVGSTLDGMPAAFFDDIAVLARSMGPVKLAEWHSRCDGVAA